MSKPLQGRSILLTRTRNQTAVFHHLLGEAGARVLEVPTIEIRSLPSSQLDGAIREINSYNWLIFSSVKGVEFFLERARQLGVVKPLADRSEFPKIGVIGPATAQKVQQYGYPVDLIPQVFQAEGLLEEFLSFHDQDIDGLRILFPRASRAREVLPQQLQRRGAKVVVVPVYDTMLPKEQRQKLVQILKEESLDLITFTSSSTVHHFVALAGLHQNLTRFCYAAIGPITAGTAQQYGLAVVVQAHHSTIPDLAQAITQYFSRSERDTRVVSAGKQH